MFSSSGSSIRKPSRFGGGNDIRPRTPTDTHYRVPLHPSADFQVNRGSLSEYDFYLVPTSQNHNSTQTPRVPSHSLPLTDINCGNQKYIPPDGSIRSTNNHIASARLPRNGSSKASEHGQQTQRCNANAPRRDRCPTHEFYNSFIDENDALRDLAPSDYNSDGTSLAGPEDQCRDDDSFLSDDELSVEPFSTGSELDCDSADYPSGNNRLASRTKRTSGRLATTSILGEDNLKASRHCTPVVDVNINKHNAVSISTDAPRDPRRIKQEPRSMFLASVPAAVEQPASVRLPSLSRSSTNSSLDSSMTSEQDPHASRFTTRHGDHDNMKSTSLDPHIWETWDINTWKAIPSARGYTLSMPRPYQPLQFTASQLRRVVEKQQKMLPRLPTSAPRTRSSVNEITSWDEFQAEYQELCSSLNLSPTAQREATADHP